MKVRVCSALLGLAVMAGCSEAGPTFPRGPGAVPPLTLEEFSGTLPVKGVLFYSFTVTTGGVTRLTLVDAKVNGATTEALITIGLGVPRGTQCLANNILSVKSGGAPQVFGETPRGVHCAVIFDQGNLTSDATFLLHINHPK